MKKRIIIVIGAFTVLFILGGLYIMRANEASLTDLRHVSQLHRAVNLEKQLLEDVRRIHRALQGPVPDRNTPFDARALQHRITAMARDCSVCHHGEGGEKAVQVLKSHLEKYMELAFGVLMAPSSAGPAAGNRDQALSLGESLIQMLGDSILFTDDDFDYRERAILQRVDNRRSVLLLILLIGPLVAAGVAFYLISGITKPFHVILLAAQQLQAGNYDFRAEGLKNEFQEVADSLNKAGAALKERLKEMQLTEQLRVSGEMAAGLAHEIRNPLAAIKLTIEVFLEDQGIKDGDRKLLAQLLAEVKRVEMLMSEFLSFAKPAPPQFQRVQVNQILEECLVLLEKHPLFQAPETRMHALLKPGADLPETTGDLQKLHQVFLNLLLNALEAMPAGGTVTVQTKYVQETGRISIEFSDCGKGISPAALPRIFEPFFTTKAKGTGLGLAVTKRLVEEHDGTIRAANNAGGGATFTVELPVRSQEEEGAA